MNKSSILLILLLASCETSVEEINIRRFTDKDFAKSISLTGSKELLPQMFNPFLVKLVRDSILITQNLSANVENFNFIDIYNFNTNQKIVSCLYLGRGPGEWLSCDIAEISNSEMIIHDAVQSRVSIFNLDSLINEELEYRPRQIRVPQFTGAIVRFDEDYFVAADSRFLRNTDFNNPQISRLFKFPIDGLSDDELSNFLQFDVDNFVSNVAQTKILSNKGSNKIVVVNQIDDEIEFYDSSLKLIDILKGPDNFRIEYKKVQRAGVITEGDYTSYYGVCKGADCFYAVYAGRNGIDEDFVSPVEIFQIDWDGNPIKKYEIDVFGFWLSFNSEYSVMYTVGYNPETEVSFYRFDL